MFYKKISFQNFISFSKMPKITFLCQTSHYYVENKKKSKLLSFNCFYTEYKTSDHIWKKIKTLWPLFYGWGSTASRIQPLRGGSLLFTIQFPEIPGTHFIGLGRMKSWIDFGATQWFWTREPWIGNPAP